MNVAVPSRRGKGFAKIKNLKKKASIQKNKLGSHEVK